jgi:GntR family transcriptional regulator
MIGAFQRSQAPLYLQLASGLRNRVESGQWKPGTQIPTLEELMAEFNVSRVTLRQALGILADEGYLSRQQGRGTFVLKSGNKPWLTIQSQTDWSSLMKIIKGTKTQVLFAEEHIEHPEIEEDFPLMAAEYFHMRRLHSKDDIPYAIINIFLSQQVYELAPQFFRNQPILSGLDQLPEVRIKMAKQILTVGIAGIEAGELLHLTVDAPVVNIQRYVTDEKGILIYFGKIIYRADFVKLEIDLVTRESTVIPPQQ